ncbi:MAG: SIMPL domain-containing protein [Candidatus Portnoybacteria bacterium]|nr:SIMPL domain-containing protein [Candidatus Portnoybacteria bacterium]
MLDDEKNLNLKIIPPSQYLPWVAVGVAVFLAAFLLAQTINTFKEGRYIGQSSQYKNTISVAGEGKVVGKPDIGQVSLSVVSQAITVVTAQKTNTEKMDKVIKAMKDLGVAEEDLKTASYSIYPRYQYVSGRSDIIGYEITQTLEVKIRDLEKSGEILGQAAAAGANQVGSLFFTFDDPEKIKSEARQEAIEQAKQKADDLAASLGVTLGKVASFSESSSDGTNPVPMYSTKEAYGLGGGSATPDIETGQNEVMVYVNIAYEIY